MFDVTCLIQHVWFILSIQRVISARSFAVHLSFVSVFHFSCQCWIVHFLSSSTFTVSTFTFVISHTLFCSLYCRPIGITPVMTNIADAALSATVRCTYDKILNLQSTFNAFARPHCRKASAQSRFTDIGNKPIKQECNLSCLGCSEPYLRVHHLD